MAQFVFTSSGSLNALTIVPDTAKNGGLLVAQMWFARRAPCMGILLSSFIPWLCQNFIQEIKIKQQSEHVEHQVSTSQGLKSIFNQSVSPCCCRKIYMFFVNSSPNFEVYF